ncbi:MAG: hypothetical protein O7G88_01830 [bacterium]|nr:hypothetical protein [bacterium]
MSNDKIVKATRDRLGLLLYAGMLCIMLVHAAPLRAQDRIEPLVGVNWQDTLVETIIKLNHLQTLTRLYVQESPDNVVHLEGMRDRQRVLQRLSRLWRDGNGVSSRMVDNDAFHKTVVIVAEPIRLFHIDFMIYISFVPAGKRLDEDQQPIATQRRSHRHHEEASMRMTHVVLSKTKDAVFNQATVALLRAYAVKTYGHYKNFQSLADEMVAKDEAGRVFFVRFKAAEWLRDMVQGYRGNCMLQFSNRYRRR